MWANIQAMLAAMTRDGVYTITENRAPISGAAGADGYGYAENGATFIDNYRNVLYINEGSAQGVYWTPVNLFQRNLLSWHSDFRDGAGIVVSDTAALYTNPATGIKIFGQGLAETDSGFVVAIAEDGAIGTLTTTDENAHVAAIGVGLTTSVPFQPDAHGPMVVDALFAVDAALTLRRVFVGFIGTAADALDPPVTGATVTLTLVQDDVAGMMFDAGLTDAAGIMLPHNKSDEAATILVTDTAMGAVDTDVDSAAFGVYQRWRVEVLANGTMKAFKNKVLIGTITTALDVDEEVAPVLLVGSTTTATKAILVKHFSTWGQRNGVL